LFALIPLEAKPAVWSQDARWPMLLATSMFGMQLLVSAWMLSVSSAPVTGLDDRMLEWKKSLAESLRGHISIALTGFIAYMIHYLCKNQLLVEQPILGNGYHLLSRNLHWLFSTPSQWYLFAKICTTAEWPELSKVILACVGMQILGILMVIARDPANVAVCYLLSSMAFVDMFKRVFALPLKQQWMQPGRRIRKTCLFLWSIYPLTVQLRLLGWMSDWTEQVLIYSVTDVVCKSTTLITILLSQFLGPPSGGAYTCEIKDDAKGRKIQDDEAYAAYYAIIDAAGRRKHAQVPRRNLCSPMKSFKARNNILKTVHGTKLVEIAESRMDG